MFSQCDEWKIKCFIRWNAFLSGPIQLVGHQWWLFQFSLTETGYRAALTSALLTHTDNLWEIDRKKIGVFWISKFETNFATGPKNFGSRFKSFKSTKIYKFHCYQTVFWTFLRSPDDTQARIRVVKCESLVVIHYGGWSNWELVALQRSGNRKEPFIIAENLNNFIIFQTQTRSGSYVHLPDRFGISRLVFGFPKLWNPKFRCLPERSSTQNLHLKITIFPKKINWGI